MARGNTCKKEEDWGGNLEQFVFHSVPSDHSKASAETIICSSYGNKFRDSCSPQVRSQMMAPDLEVEGCCFFCGEIAVQCPREAVH